MSSKPYRNNTTNRIRWKELVSTRSHSSFFPHFCKKQQNKNTPLIIALQYSACHIVKKKFHVTACTEETFPSAIDRHRLCFHQKIFTTKPENMWIKWNREVRTRILFLGRWIVFRLNARSNNNSNNLSSIIRDAMREIFRSTRQSSHLV